MSENTQIPTDAAAKQPVTSQPVMGPDMGQPHFSYTTPGDPYQGAPVSGAEQAAPQTEGGQPSYQPMQQPVYAQPVYQQPVQQPMQQPVYGQPVYQQPVQQPMQQPVYGQPVYQQPVQQPMQQPVYGQPVYQQPVQQPMQQPVYGQPVQQPAQATSEEQVKQFVDLVKDTADGKADPSSFLNFFNGIDDNFWKGLLVGAGVTFLCTSSTVRSIFASGSAGLFGNKEEMSAEEAERLEDLKAEEAYKAAQAAKAAEAGE